METVMLMHEAYTDKERLGDSTIFCWHKAFSEDRETVVLLPHIGRPLSICAEVMANAIPAVVQEDLHITVQQLAEALHNSKSSVHTILYEVENVESYSWRGSSFPNSRTERPLY